MERHVQDVYKLIKVPGYNALFPEMNYYFLLCKMQQK